MSDDFEPVSLDRIKALREENETNKRMRRNYFEKLQALSVETRVEVTRLREAVDLLKDEVAMLRRSLSRTDIECERLREAIRLTVEEYPGYEEMDRIAAAIGLPGYTERVS